MTNLDALEAARGGPFVFQHKGEPITGADPASLNYQWVLLALHEQTMPNTPGDMAYWRVQVLFEAWQSHHDLPDFHQAQRLAYLVDHYIDTLTYDLQAHLGVDLGSLWRARRWNTLLAYVDRLPRWSLYSEAVANDPEHAEMLAKALAEGEERDASATSSGPPLSTFTPEVEAIFNLTDAVRALHYIIPASQGGKGQPPTPLPRPTTLVEQARRRVANERRMAKHNSLVARMLPHKAEGEQPQWDTSETE